MSKEFGFGADPDESGGSRIHIKGDHEDLRTKELEFDDNRKAFLISKF
jgi:hypothetical protein